MGQKQIYHMARCQGPRTLIGRPFFICIVLVLTIIWQENAANISKAPGALHNVNPALGWGDGLYSSWG